MKKKIILFAAMLFSISGYKSFAQISFTTNVNSGCKPLSVTFTNTSTEPGAVNFYLYFGDGNNSTKPDTAYTYQNAGNYYPYLYAYDSNWNYIGSYYGNQITVLGASYINSPDSACPGDFVSFQNYDNANSWSWNFGDGNYSNQQYTNHTYSSLGPYTVTLTLSTNCGTYVLNKNINITNTIPASPISFSHYPNPSCPNTQINHYPGANAVSYLWNFGDGFTDTVPNPSHSYSTANIYPVTLITTNGCGNSATYTDSAYIVSYIPFDNTAAIDLSPDSACPNENINMYAPYGGAAYIFNYGDGSALDSSAGYYRNHVYAALGYYNLTAKMYNNCGNDTTYSITVPIVNTIGFLSGLSASNNSPACPGNSITFQAPYGYSWYVWNYGDGSPLDSVDFNYGPLRYYTYPSVGTYTASVTIYNACGNDTTLYTTVNITNSEPVPGSVSLSNNSPVCPGTATGIYTNYGYPTYVWNYGDGSPSDSLGSNGEYRNHIYSAVGTYTASVTIYNTCGSDTTLYTTVNVTNSQPVPSYVSLSNNTPVCPGANVGLWTNYGFASYVWDFGDGSPADSLGPNGENRYHIYGTVGAYTASVTIYNSCGNDTTIYTTVTISSTEPVPSYVNLNNSSPACPGSNISLNTNYGFASYVWNYGDGSPSDSLGSNGEYRNHIYSAVGTYTASVTIYNNCGNDTTLYTTVNINNNNPIPSNVTLNNNSPACPGGTVQLNTDYGFTTYIWNFGDGSPLETANLTNGGWYRYHIYDTVGIYTASVTLINDCGNDSTLYTTVDINTNSPFPGNMYFSHYPSVACPNDNINFNTESGYVSYQWNFGDGSPVVTTNNAYNNHQYPAPGPYTASVTIVNACGNDTTLTNQVSIINYAPFNNPIGIYVNNSTSCPGQDISIYTDYYYAASYQWNFGDGSPLQTSTNYSINHTYTALGTYTVTLKITSNCGNDTTVTGVINILYPPFPAMAMNINTSPACPNQTIEFYVNDGFYKYIWSFGDSTADFVNYGNGYANHAFPDTGTYAISVKILQNCGINYYQYPNLYKDTTIYATVSVTNNAGFNQPVSMTSYPGQCSNIFNFYASQGFASYTWDFGDGDTNNTPGAYANHNYDTAGTYTASVTITNYCGSDTTLSQGINVSQTGYGNFLQPCAMCIPGDSTSPYQILNPVPSKNNDPWNWYSDLVQNICPGESVYLNLIAGTVYPGNGFDNQIWYVQDKLSYVVWHYGDGTPDDTVIINNQQPEGIFTNHTFNNLGTDTFSVTLYHECGNDTTVYGIITVDSTLGFPNVINLYGNQNPCVNENISFAAYYQSGGYVGNTLQSYVWNFGDGSPLDTTQGASNNHQFPDTGTYSVSLALTNYCGNDTTVTRTVNVVNYKPFNSNVVLNSNMNNACPGENVWFWADLFDEIVTFEWNFGDGSPVVVMNNSNNGNPGGEGSYLNHQYADTGTYTVSLTLTNKCGNDTMVTKTINVVGYKGFPANVDMYHNPDPACPGDFVYFNAQSGYATYVWNFGDSTPLLSGNMPYVNHTYSNTGTFEALLTITNFCGNDTTLSETVNINGNIEFGPYTPFGEPWYLQSYPYSACPGQNVNFYAPEGLPYYTWDFGDGIVDSVSNFRYTNHSYDTAGTYSVSVTIRNNCGSDTTIFSTVVIDNNLGFSNLSMSLSSPASCPGQEVQINGPYGYVSYIFNFGDGSAADSSDAYFARHIYQEAGTYNVGLTIYNYCGNDTTIYAPVTIDTNVSFTYAPQINAYPSNGCPGQELAFFTESGHLSYAWNFDDGSMAQGAYYVQHSFDTVGTYNVDVTITNFCGNDTTVSVNVSVSDTISTFPNISVSSLPSVSCPGDMVELSVNGGYASYFWTFGDGDTLTSSGNNVEHIYQTAGNYNASVKITNGCGYTYTAYAALSVNSNAPVDTSLFVSVPFNPSCPGDEVFFNVINGASTYVYNWDFSDGASDSTVGAGTSHVFASVGTFPVTLTATNGCGNTKSISVSTEISNSVIPWMEAGETFGFGTGDASGIAGCPADAVLFWFAGTFNNLWDFGDGSTGTATEQVMTGMGVPVTVIKHVYSSTGTYSPSLTLTNNCGNSVTDSITITIDNNQLVNGSIFIAPPTGTSGYTTCSSIDMIGTGGSNYAWDFGDGDTITTVSPTISHTYANPGTYTVSVKVTNGCGYSATYFSAITVNGIGGPLATVAADSTSCFGGSDGSASVTVTNGIAPFTYIWDVNAGTQTDSAATGLSAGTYAVSVVDNLGCSTLETITVYQPSDMSITATVNNSTCGASDGSAIVTVSGGTGGPYTYNWSNGSTISFATGLFAGNYSVTVTNASGCTRVENIAVNNGNAATVTVAGSSNVSCNGGADGSIDISVSGGTSPYTYLWSDSAATEDISGLGAGTYSITVTDANSCVSGQSVTITQPNKLSLSTSVTNANCGSFNGSATVNVSGGTAAYSYLWDENTGNKTTATVTGFPAGQYEVFVTDAKGCTDSITAVISNANAPSISATVTNVSCNGAANGAITQTVSGGTNPYLYNWSNGSNTKNISGLAPGSYTVIITDASNCVSIRNYTITQPDVLSASANAVAASCGNADGTASVSATGGTTSYSYIWTGGQTTSSVTGLADGTYSVTVTDSKGCTATAIATVTEPSTFASLSYSDSVNCNSGADGAAAIIPAGGNSPYTYAWSTSANSDTITGVSAGSYSVTATDVNGCTSVQTISIGEPAVLSLSFTISDALCYGNANGTMVAVVTGGTAPYTYLWNTGDSTSQLSGLAAQTYYLTVTDNNNCTHSDSAAVNEPDQLSATISSLNASCFDVCDASATVSPAGGTSPYTYIWTNGDNADLADSLCDGNYTVNISDANNCQASQNVTITEPDSLTFSLTSVGTTCGNSDGFATVNAAGGTVPYTYSWSNNQTDSVATALGLGSISVTVSDANGCQATASDSIATFVPPLDICIVTVDSSSTKNLVVWEKPNANYIDSFRIYREIVGTYTYIGSVDYIDLSKFVDNTNGVNPNITSYKYKVSVIDNCGNESALSDYQKTMHLQTIFQAGEVDLSWDNYDGFGMSFYYRILRDSTGSGNWQVLDSVSFGNTQYTDINPPSGNIDYMMEVVHPFGGCLATKMVENHNSSRSNRGQATNAAPLTATTTSTDASQGNCDGTATVTASGGIAPYNYLWDNNAGNQTSDTATGLCPGNYSVTVTDQNGNTTTATVTVLSAGSTLSASVTSTDASSGNCDGTAMVTANGGTSPYSYAWSANANGQTTSTITGLCAGTYSVTVTDNDGNTFVANTTLNIAGSTLAANITAVTNTTDTVNCNGSATVTASGGTTPYTYTWSDGQTTATATGLCGGNYTVSVTDADANTVVLSVTVGVDVQPGVTEAMTAEGITIYPNPSGGNFIVQGTDITSVSVYNMLGEIIYHQDSLQPASLVEIDLGDRSTGVYYVQAQSKFGLVTIKTIVK